MTNKSNSPREYIPLELPNTAIIKPTKYMSKPAGHISEIVDFNELNYHLGFKFEPRSMFTITSPKMISRGGHLESRSKVVTITAGLAYICLIDMRPGKNQGKACEFYLGEGEKSQGTSAIIPEGVIDHFIPISENTTILVVGDRPYNKFDSVHTLDINDPSLKLHLPKGAVHHVPVGEELKVLSVKDFINIINL